MCTGILEKAVHYSYRDVNDPNGSMSIWRATYWKWLAQFSY